jgi:AcrR family transcriptional regulator
MSEPRRIGVVGWTEPVRQGDLVRPEEVDMMTRARLTEAEGRAALLDAATEIVTETGSPNITVREVAARAGINHGLVHRYFGTKDTLIDSVIDEISATVAQQLESGGGQAIVHGDAMGTLARLIGHAMISGDDSFDDADRPHPVADVLIRRLRQENAMSEEAARLAAAQIIALTLGWRLNESFLVGSCGLGDRSTEDLREQLHAACLRVIEQAGSSSEPSAPAPVADTSSSGHAAPNGYAMSGARPG